MFIKQLSIFVENKPGRLKAVIDSLGESGVNLRALSIADTTNFGILRVIVDDIEKAQSTLKEKEVISKITDVIAVIVDDKSGSLAKALNVIVENDINIEYVYAFLGKTAGKALMVVKTDNDMLAVEILEKNNFVTATSEDI